MRKYIEFKTQARVVGVGVVLLLLFVSLGMFAYTVHESGVVRAQAVHAQIEKTASQVQVQGTIEVMHYDDITGASHNEYYLAEAGKKTRLVLSDSAGERFVGSRVQVNGVESQGGIVVGNTPESINLVEPAPQGTALGEQRTLVLLTSFLDAPTPPFSIQDAQRFMFESEVNDYFKEISYGKTWLSGDVYGWIELPRKPLVGGSCVFPGPVYAPAEFYNILHSNDIDIKQYTRVVILMNTEVGAACSGGNSSIGTFEINDGTGVHHISSLTANTGIYSWPHGAGTWNTMYKTIAHELGHSFGLWHSNSMECPASVVVADICTHTEYGNWYDVMGSPFTYNNGSYNARQKDALKWFGASLLTIAHSGRYTIQALGDRVGFLAAKIQPPGHTTPFYYIEKRKAVGVDSWLTEPLVSSNLGGVFINNYVNSHLLDATPTSADDYADWFAVSMNPGGAPFTDPEGITIGPVIVSDSNSATFDVNIAMPPVSFTLAASQISGVGGLTTVLSGSYNNLACPFDYYWLDFGDGTPQKRIDIPCSPITLNTLRNTLVSGSMANVSHTYSQPGIYTAKLIAAGVESNKVTITVLPEFEVTYPNTSESFKNGTPITVRWRNLTTVTSGTVDIDIITWAPPCISKRSGCAPTPTYIYPIAKNVPDSEIFSWVVGQDYLGNQIPAGQYVVRVTKKSTGKSAESVKAFTILPK